ncbi:hypothetical protein LIER_44117 [Lithospermum erythrorhizon]|uniref:Reverse transcriptase zinc-binding domain-containing protein n=1 Tax=Lithospermum erythrorhizon TaxID=34254 RepID=A0AAV3PTA7_LITER
MALLTRTLWDIHMEANTLWVKWVHAIYLRGRTIWEYTTRNRDSYLMKRLCTIRDAIVLAYGSPRGAIAGMAKMVAGRKFLSGKVYELLRTPRPRRPWMSTIWKHYIPPKYTFTVWLACRNRLATTDNLLFFAMADWSCVFCKGPMETKSHLFFACPFTSAIWGAIKEWLGIKRQMNTCESAIKWLKKEFEGCRVNHRAARLGFAATIYEIWMARNALRFDGTKPAQDAIIAKVKVATYRILYRIFPENTPILLGPQRV